jgi:cyclohexyl-isocyanide hydratase
MIIGIPIYEKVDLLDVAAPYEIFSLIKEFDKKLKPTVYLIAAKPGIIKTRDGFMMKPHKVFSEVPRLDVLWVPGGDPAALKKLMNDPARTYLNFLITRSRKARLVTSVCEGALLLAQAGLLDGYNATTHWAFIPCLKKFPAIKVVERYPRFCRRSQPRHRRRHFIWPRRGVEGGGIAQQLRSRSANPATHAILSLPPRGQHDPRHARMSLG